MRLSEAIALGRTVVIPRSGVILEVDGGGCALGMAGIASGNFTAGEYHPSVDRLATSFPWALRDTPPCPCPCRHMQGQIYKVTGIIGHIFDMHVMGLKDWTLDQLIDWVRSVEPAELEAIGREQQRCDAEVGKYRP